MDIDVIEAADRKPALEEELAGIWERSVRATHGFLSGDDIAALRPEVRGALASVAQLAVAREDGRALAFAGAQNGKLEMLFCAPEARGRGVGRALLAFAVKHWDAHRLDVNEQNPAARGFYEHEGFAVAGRSATDDAGRPFPLLHMARTSGVRAEMASGAWFDAADPALELDRVRARQVMLRLNTDPALSPEERVDDLRDLLGAIGPGTDVALGAQVDYGYGIFMGSNCFFNFNCTFLDGARIAFGDDVWVGPNCTFATPLHPLVARERPVRMDADGTPHLWERNLPITVGDRVWIAANVTVNPGVTIGEGVVIGSGSVVTKDVPPNVLALGNPCRIVREITEADRMAGASGVLR